MTKKDGKNFLPHEKQIHDYENAIAMFKEQNEDGVVFSSEDMKNLEDKLKYLKEKVYDKLSPCERLQICRHSSRPRFLDYVENLCDDFIELFGDRTIRDDPSIVGGLALIAGMKCVVIGQEKGKDTESRVHRNFGMLHPEGFRKALRLIKMAEKFNLPVVSFLDTPGAHPGLEAEERGQGWAIAKNLFEIARVSTPIIIVIIGEGFSGGALGMGIGDCIGMLEHAYYAVISPEGCASILWKDVSKSYLAVDALKGNSEYLLNLGVIDEIIKEPLGGAHHKPEIVYEGVKSFILRQWDILKAIPSDVLLEKRYAKYRKMGKFKKSH